MPVQKATPQPDGSIIHTVLTGQTLWTIAAVYEIKLEDVYELNGLNRFSFVFPGDEILVCTDGVVEAEYFDRTKAAYRTVGTRFVAEHARDSVEAIWTKCKQLDRFRVDDDALLVKLRMEQARA